MKWDHCPCHWQCHVTSGWYDSLLLLGRIPGSLFCPRWLSTPCLSISGVPKNSNWNDHLMKMSIEIATHSRRKRCVLWVCRFWAHMTRDLPFPMTTGTEAQKVLEQVRSWRGGDGYGSKTQRTGAILVTVDFKTLLVLISSYIHLGTYKSIQILVYLSAVASWISSQFDLTLKFVHKPMKIQKSSNACNLKQYRLRLKYTLWFGTDTRTEEMLWFSLPKIHLNTWSLLSKKRCAGLESFVACSICLVSNHTTYTVFRVEYDSEAKRVGDIPTVPAPGKAKNLAKSWWSGITKEACRNMPQLRFLVASESWSKMGLSENRVYSQL